MGLNSETGEENRYEAFLKRKTGAIVSTTQGIQYIENTDPSLKFRIISFFQEESGNDKVLFYSRYAIGIIHLFVCGYVRYGRDSGRRFFKSRYA